MAKKGIIDEIIEKLESGVSREELEKTYKKGTITKAENKLKKENSSEDVKEFENLDVKKYQETLTNCLKEIINEIDKNIECTITIDLKRKNDYKFGDNIYQDYSNLGKEKFKDKIRVWEKDKLKQYITKKLDYEVDKAMNKNELIDFICNRIENALNIGKAFYK